MSNRFVALVEAAYGSQPGEPHWNAEADLNDDGVVDYRDLGIAGAMVDVNDGFPAIPSPAMIMVIGVVLLWAFMR